MNVNVSRRPLTFTAPFCRPVFVLRSRDDEDAGRAPGNRAESVMDVAWGGRTSILLRTHWWPCLMCPDRAAAFCLVQPVM